MSITDSLNYTYTNGSRFTINYTYSKLNYCSLASMNWSVISSNALDSSALCLAASIKTRIDINFFKLNHWSTKTSLNQIDVTKDIKYEKKKNLES